MTCTIGVDFGTSTTEVAIYDGSDVQLVRGWDGSPILPSVAAYMPNGSVEVGKPAKARAGIDPKNTIHSVKRIIGLPYRAEAVQKFAATYGFELKEGMMGVPIFVTRAGEKTAKDVAYTILKHIRDYPVFEAISPQKIIVTVPSAFAPAQRKDIVAAAQQAGFKNVDVLEEPYAAVMPYLNAANTKERYLGVYDLGGGTFDFAVVKVAGLSHFLEASGGAQSLGGNDIDAGLADWIASEVLMTHRQDLKSDRSVFHRLLLAAEEAKIALSDTASTSIELKAIDPSLPVATLQIQRAQLEKLSAELVRRTFSTCDEVLASAKLDARDISEVILVGGASRMPAVQLALKHYFRKDPTMLMSPDEVVAAGAAMGAANLT